MTVSFASTSPAAAIEPGEVLRPGAWERKRPERASDQIVLQIRNALFEDRLRAGDMVGSEGDLASQYGVSRATIRDALRALEVGGIVEVRTGVKGGARIAAGDPNKFADALAVQLKLVGLNPLDAMAAQVGLEWVAGELAAVNATPEERALLSRIVAESAGCVDSPADFNEASLRFHQTVALASHNWAVTTNLRAIREIIGESRNRYTTPQVARRVQGTHEDICAAILQRDSAVSGQLIRDHLGSVRHHAEETLQAEQLNPIESRLSQPKTAEGEGFAPVRSLRASDEIARQIRRALFEDRLHPGDSLGSVADLEARFGVSRSAVKDALRTLEASNLVEVRAGAKGGVRVAQGDPYGFADTLAVQLKLVGLNVGDAIAAELGLEWVAAELAAACATDADVAHMAKLLEESAAHIDSSPEFVRSSMAFHEAVAAASHNWAVVTNLRAIRELIGRTQMYDTPPDRARRVQAVHSSIYEAIRAHNSELAVQLMREHVSITLQSRRQAHQDQAYCA